VRALTARLCPTVQGPCQQPAHRRGTNARGDGDVAVAELLGAKRQEQAIAHWKSLQGLARRPQLAIFIRKLRWRDARIVRRRPRDPSAAPALSVASRMSGDREEPSTQIAGVPSGAQMVQKLQESFLHHILRVLLVTQQDPREAKHGRAVLLEEVPCRLRRVCGRIHLIPLSQV
jgi:hypothetical protein